MALVSRFGVSILWKSPFQLYEIWWAVLFGYSFYMTQSGFVIYSLIYSAVLTVTLILEISSNLEENGSRLKIQDTPEHKLRISEIVVEGVLVIIGFASIYFSISVQNPDSFNNSLNILDSIYYSFMVGTTVGFGNVHPTSDIAKILTIVEAFLGFIFIVFMVSIFLNIWIDKKMKK